MTDKEINEAVARKLGFEGGFAHCPNCLNYHWLTEAGCGPFPEPPNYCDSIEAAWEVVEYLKNHSVTLRKSDPLSGWWCNIFSWEGYPNGEKQPEIEAEADTAPMAICLAFLKLTVPSKE